MTRAAVPPASGAIADQPRPRAPRPRFGVVDELSCYHDHPAEPNIVHLEARLPGHLDEASLRAAVAATLATEPRARRRQASWNWLSRTFAWETPPHPDCDPVAMTTWASEADLDRERSVFLARSPPLDSSPPFRLLLAVGPDQDCVILSAHHAAFDGQSCLELLRVMADHYSRSAQVGQAPDAGHSPSQTTTGARPGPPSQARSAPQTSAAPAADQPGGGRGRGVPRAVTRIAADRTEGTSNGYGYHLMPVIQLSYFQPLRRQFSATVNDLLIGALIVAITDWNAAHGRRARRVRITMPVSDRPAGQAVALGNSSRLTVITAPGPASPDDVDQVMSQVVAQTRSVKETDGPEVGHLSRLLTSAWLPVGVKRGLLRGFLRTIGPAVIDTSLVTNLGVLPDPLRFGSLPASRMAFSTSAHMPRGLSAGIVTVGNELQICLRGRRALLDGVAMARFAQCYSDALSKLARRTAPGSGHRRPTG